jgi:hypothetical protein
MFGKDKLLQEGVQGQALILDAQPGNSLNGHGERNWKLQIRTKFADGQTADSECEFYDLSYKTVGQASGIEPYPLSAGVWIPVRYDEGDRTKVVVDRPKIIEDTISAYEANRQKLIEKAERAAEPAQAPSQQAQETDEAYLVDALTAAEARGDTSEVSRLTQLLEDLISGNEKK